MKNKKLKKNKWVTLFVLVLGGGSVYKPSNMKDTFYGPMQEFLSLNNTQIGALMSISGAIDTFGEIPAMYISDRFSKKKILPITLICEGIIGLYVATALPGYNKLVICWCLFPLVLIPYWSTLLKAVRLLGSADEQGRMFGFLESGRGIVDIIIAFSALGLFSAMGQGSKGFRGGIYLFSIVPIVAGVISYFLLEDDKIDTSIEKNKNIIVLKGVFKALKSPNIWLLSLNVFMVYCIYIGNSMFIPFLKDIYRATPALVGAFGIINQYGLKIIGGPIGGFLADKKFKSPTRYMRVAYVAILIAMIIIILLPHERMNTYLGIVIILAFGAIIFTMRAIFFAPMEELGVPREISGAAMALGSFVGYAPAMFMYVVNGYILDKYPGMTGYRIIFVSMIIFAIIGIGISTLMVKQINKNKAVMKAEDNK